MGRIIHPFPAPKLAALALAGVILSAASWLLRDILSDFLLQYNAAVWLLVIICSLVVLVRARFQTITLDERTISFTSGILSTRKVVLPYPKITEAGFMQSLFQRVFGVGNLSVDSAGGSETAIRVADVRQSDQALIQDRINRTTGRDSGI